jgi:hypothetical protein
MVIVSGAIQSPNQTTIKGTCTGNQFKSLLRKTFYLIYYKNSLYKNHYKRRFWWSFYTFLKTQDTKKYEDREKALYRNKV